MTINNTARRSLIAIISAILLIGAFAVASVSARADAPPSVELRVQNDTGQTIHATTELNEGASWINAYGRIPTDTSGFSKAIGKEAGYWFWEKALNPEGRLHYDIGEFGPRFTIEFHHRGTSRDSQASCYLSDGSTHQVKKCDVTFEVLTPSMERILKVDSAIGYR